MSKIVSTVTDMHGITTRTEVRTNPFDEFVIWTAGVFGRNFRWRVIHFIEKRKLRTQH
jgi:hypothetical protein